MLFQINILFFSEKITDNPIARKIHGQQTTQNF